MCEYRFRSNTCHSVYFFHTSCGCNILLNSHISKFLGAPLLLSLSYQPIAGKPYCIFACKPYLACTRARALFCFNGIVRLSSCIGVVSGCGDIQCVIYSRAAFIPFDVVITGVCRMMCVLLPFECTGSKCAIWAHVIAPLPRALFNSGWLVHSQWHAAVDVTMIFVR